MPLAGVPALRAAAIPPAEVLALRQPVERASRQPVAEQAQKAKVQWDAAARAAPAMGLAA
ncbi:MAG: hypothetical protein ABSB23_07735 [Bryobacteraceae bacterium]|jgi:hypothetical protein